VEDFGPIALFLVWVLASLFGGAGKAKRQRERARRQREQAQQPTEIVVSRDRPASRTGQPTTFDELLAEMRGQLEQAKEMDRVGSGVPSRGQYEDDPEAIEDTTTLEEDVEVVSMEVEPVRPERAIEVSQREATEALVQRRIQAAELRNREWRLEDHRRFDAQIRQVKVSRPRTLTVTQRRLRQAMIWNEVLQPPVALRKAPAED
jgi:hypothetical protein